MAHLARVAVALLRGEMLPSEQLMRCGQKEVEGRKAARQIYSGRPQIARRRRGVLHYQHCGTYDKENRGTKKETRVREG